MSINIILGRGQFERGHVGIQCSRQSKRNALKKQIIVVEVNHYNNGGCKKIYNIEAAI